MACSRKSSWPMVSAASRYRALVGASGGKRTIANSLPFMKRYRSKTFASLQATVWSP